MWRKIDAVDLVLVLLIFLALAIAGTIEANEPAPKWNYGLALEQQRVLAAEYNSRALAAGGPALWRE